MGFGASMQAHSPVELDGCVLQRVSSPVASDPTRAHLFPVRWTHRQKSLDQSARSIERVRFHHRRAIGGDLGGNVHLVADQRNRAAGERIGYGDAEVLLV